MASSTTRAIISRFASQEGLCGYCDVPLTEKNATMEHVIPRAWGGNAGGITNTILACEQCNSFKSGLESHITNQMGAHLGLTDRAALFMLRCMKRPHKNSAFKTRFTRMAYRVMEAADAHCLQRSVVIPKQHREKYL